MTPPATGEPRAPDEPRALPADGHVHTEWSWDARFGSMERSCAQAVRLGLPAIAFTDHLDHTSSLVPPDVAAADDDLAGRVGPDGIFTPPELDVAGYLDCVDRCRGRFPGLRILSGVEIGEPHRHPAQVARTLTSGAFDRVLGSIHCLPEDGVFADPPVLFRRHPPAEVMRRFLAEVAKLMAAGGAFTVLAHIDYAVRYWPAGADRFDPTDFEPEFRAALRATARAGRVLEVNTAIPLSAAVLRWWHEEGGDAVTFGSDAHAPDVVARGFAAAADLAAACGFRPGPSPFEPWPRDTVFVDLG